VNTEGLMPGLGGFTLLWVLAFNLLH
jgi:hypothetical protein